MTMTNKQALKAWIKWRIDQSSRGMLSTVRQPIDAIIQCRAAGYNVLFNDYRIDILKDGRMYDFTLRKFGKNGEVMPTIPAIV